MSCKDHDPAENLKKKPSKSILKSSSSFETADRRQGKKALAEKAKNAKWDEMNIIATLHPADKDYGHMKIDEPKTPYERTVDEDETDSLDVDLLAEKIAKGSTVPAKVLRRCSEDESSDEEETEEQKAHRKMFDSKRKAHYNEFIQAKMARQRMEEEDEDEEDEDNNQKTNEENDDETACSESGTNASSTG
ncbi:unnamed protein product [Bemisia tabaci]|uniref:Protein phosphatase inhibitor 2 n=1 Tax=Bemisia tabaci TaxID=7038 RepID=A0A9N9ZZN4_BEMTA|nr:PREDICTED: protein phosphatase inhibitor 2-like [Bemisia tabaci]CAH0382710.1 unnamed protein product [Bemisia tabaci]